MKAAFFLILSAILVSSCASQGAIAPSSAGEQVDQESRYSQSLPATDMGASQPRDQELPGEAASENSSSPEPGRERTYSRELTLEEEMVFARPSEEENIPEDQSGPEQSEIDLNNTFTLQLVAMESMEGAVNYARQYRIDPKEAGVARILSHDKIYFVLAYGVYATYAQAEQASLELQKQGVPEPWVRRLGTLERLSMEADDFQPIP